MLVPASFILGENENEPQRPAVGAGVNYKYCLLNGKEMAKIATVVLLCSCPWQRDSAATLTKGRGLFWTLLATNATHFGRQSTK